MKKLLIISAALLLSTAAWSQSMRFFKTSASGDSGLAYTLPQTSITVNIKCERESVRRGPFARFAQKYFGTMAPLADKDVYSIVDAWFETYEESDPSKVYFLDNATQNSMKLYNASVEGLVSKGADGQTMTENRFEDKTNLPATDDCCNPLDTSFMSVPLSKHSSILGSLEEQAAEAAEALFTLRRRRFDLVTGEMGENVFGAGLCAAIQEMERMEKEYLALFFGKTFKTTEVKSYEIVPKLSQTAAIVCRFSSSTGLVPSSDLAGSPIVLELIPEKKAKGSVLPETIEKGKEKVEVSKAVMRVADIVSCSLIDGNRTITQQRIPLFQFGEIVEVPASAL